MFNDFHSGSTIQQLIHNHVPPDDMHDLPSMDLSCFCSIATNSTCFVLFFILLRNNVSITQGSVENVDEVYHFRDAIGMLMHMMKREKVPYQ